MGKSRLTFATNWANNVDTPNITTVSNWVASSIVTNPASTEINKCCFILIGHEASSSSEVASVGCNGQNATKLISSLIVSGFSNEASLWYFTDAQLVNIPDGAQVYLTYTGITPNALVVLNAIFANVNQSNPLYSSDEYSAAGLAYESIPLSVDALIDNPVFALDVQGDDTIDVTFTNGFTLVGDYDDIFSGGDCSLWSKTATLAIESTEAVINDSVRRTALLLFSLRRA